MESISSEAKKWRTELSLPLHNTSWTPIFIENHCKNRSSLGVTDRPPRAVHVPTARRRSFILSDDTAMATFRRVPCSPDLLFIFWRKQPNFYHSVRFEIEKRLPLISLSLYSFMTNGATYWYAFKKNSAITSQGDFDADEFVEGFQLFNDAAGITNSQKSYYFVADKLYTDAVLQFLKSNDYRYKEHYLYSFYVDPDQEDLLESEELERLPEGYSVDDASLEDADWMTKSWGWSDPNEIEQTRMKLTCLPSTRLLFQGKTVGFEMTDPNGTLTHLYLLPEHRGKRLGTYLELTQMKKCLKQGMIVSKLVEAHNEKIVNASVRSPFWSMTRKLSGEPIFRLYLAVWPKGSIFKENI